MRLILTMTAFLVSACILSACAGSPVAAERDARLHYEASVANYRNCLAANPSNVNACQVQRLTMETDERAFNNMSASLNGRFGGGQQSIVVQQTR
jgi:hypothetical protein